MTDRQLGTLIIAAHHNWKAAGWWHRLVVRFRAPRQATTHLGYWVEIAWWRDVPYLIAIKG